MTQSIMTTIMTVSQLLNVLTSSTTTLDNRHITLNSIQQCYGVIIDLIIFQNAILFSGVRLNVAAPS
jgi:hypothetical protein